MSEFQKNCYEFKDRFIVGSLVITIFLAFLATSAHANDFIDVFSDKSYCNPDYVDLDTTE